MQIRPPDANAAGVCRKIEIAKPRPHAICGEGGELCNKLPTELLDDLILFTAGKAAYGTFSVDSSHHRFNRYTLVEYTKKSKGQEDTNTEERWVADTCEHHALISPDGIVLASIVTDRDTADSTVFAKLCAKLPKGSGVALGDSAYCSSDNCDAVVATGRDPFFEPKKNYTGKGPTLGPRWSGFGRNIRAGSTKFTRPGPP